jgi:hypothetical protein
MLTPYLEGAVTPEQRLLVEDHLSSCENCTCVMEDLRKTGELVKDLEEIEPPPWLAPKIMARVREEADHRGGVLRWLFYPLHMKLPLEAFAVILIVGLTAFLYRAMVPQYEAARMDRGTGPVLHQDDLRAPASSAEDPGWANDAQARHEKALQETPKKFAAEEKRRTYAEQSSSTRGSAGLGSRQDSPDRSEESQPAYASKAPLLMPDPGRPSPPQKGLVRTYPETVAPTSGGIVKMKSERFDLTVRVTDVADAAKKVEKLLDEAGAHQITRDSRDGRESISAELKGDKVNSLLQKLSAIGDTRGSAPDTRVGETVAIRIDLFDTVKAEEGIQRE